MVVDLAVVESVTFSPKLSVRWSSLLVRFLGVLAFCFIVAVLAVPRRGAYVTVTEEWLVSYGY